VDFFTAILLGAIQGLTEWLPVSSSGHLALAQHYFGWAAPVAFDVMLHFGTLLAVIAYFWRDIKGLFYYRAKGLQYLFLIVAALIPTAVIGLSFKSVFESMYSQPLLIAVALVITGVFLIVAERFSQPSQEPDVGSAFLVGLAQGVAVAPGISRSGATIGMGLLSGFKREEAARFSFLLAIPAVIGAAALEGVKSFTLAGLDPLGVIAGTVAAAVVGYWSIGFLYGFLKRGKLSPFAYYCFALAAVVFAAEFFR